MKYNAFISYRHTELDMETAKKLHKGLETFRIPKSVQKKYGKKRIERVFRDQEELPIGSDLDDNITKALSDSEYLIVICSPRTPESYWVCKEIDSFISLHDREHVLAVLIEGEPAESFPPQLLTDEKGNPVEPLAADVRGTTPAERDKKFKTELMRLVSPLIGCNYDELRQRHRERIMRRNMAIIGGVTGTAAVLGLAFGIYNAKVATQMKALADDKARLAEESSQLAAEKSALADEKAALADEILLQYQETQKNQSRFYAEKSLSLLAEGKRELAALIALEGLPGGSVGDGTGTERPYVPECEYALSSALHVYDDGNQLDFDRVLKHDQIVTEMKFSKDNKYLFSMDSGQNVYLWDPENMELITKIPFYLYCGDTDSFVAANADDDGIYVVMQSGLYVFDHAGKEKYRTDSIGYILSADFDSEKKIAFLTESNRVSLIDLTNGQITKEITNDLEESFGSKTVYAGNGIYLVTHFPESGKKNSLTVIDERKGKLSDIGLADEAVLRLAVSLDGHVAVLSCNEDFYYSKEGVKRLKLEWIDPKNGVVWKKNTDISIHDPVTFLSHLKIQEYSADGKKVCRIIAAIEDRVYEWDAKKGDETASFPVSNDVETLLLSTTGAYGVVAYPDGIMDWIDTENGRRLEYQRVESNLPLQDLLFYGDKRLIRPAKDKDIYILAYHTGIGIEELPGLENEILPVITDPNEKFYVAKDRSNYSIYYYFDKDGNLLYRFDQSSSSAKSQALCGEKHIMATMDGLWYVDPIAKNAEFLDFSDLGTDDIFLHSSFSKNGRYCVFWFMKKTAVVDVEERRIIQESEYDGDINYALISDDGKTMVIASDNTLLSVTDTETGAEKKMDATGQWEFSSAYINAPMFLDNSGSRLAVFCSDGNVRIIDLSSCEVTSEIPFQSKQPGFAAFTDDDSCLLFQASSQPAGIYNLSNGDFRDLRSTNASLNHFVTDSEHNLFVCICSDGAYVFTLDDFTLIAYVPDAISYFRQDSTFIQRNRLNVFRSKYMDYHALEDEAKRQLNGAVLSEKEKLEYNIE